MKVCCKIAFFVSTLSLCITMRAQQPAFYHLSTAEGLSDNNVNNAVIDKNGILWIATTEGLNSFDGNRITTYYKQSHPELTDNDIERVLVDDANRIWVRTEGHYLTMLDAKRRFHKILIGDTTSSSGITGVFLTNEHGIIVLKGSQHYFQHPSAPLQFTRKKLPFEEKLTGPSGFTYFLNNQTVVYYRSSSLIVIDYNKIELKLHHRFPGLSGANYINNDDLLLYTVKGDVFYRFSISQQKVIKEYRNITDQYNMPLSGNLRNVTRIDSNRFAFTSYFAGVYVVDLQKQMAQHWVHDPVDPRSIGGNNTLNIRYDSSGYLFITTQTSGLHFFNLKQKQVAAKPYFADAAGEVFDGYIQSITADKDNTVWLGAQDRLIKWNSNTGKSGFIPLILADGTNIHGRETIRQVNKDDKNNLWAGTTRYGLFVFDHNMKKLAHIADSMPGGKTELPSSWINALCQDKQGNWWVGTLRGVCMVNSKNFEVTLFKKHPLLDTISKGTCTSLWKDEDGSMWIGTTKGVWHYSEAVNKMVHYSTKEGLPDNTVHAINKDGMGNTYFATLGGLSVLSAHGKISTYNRSNGLRNDRCEGLLKDDKGYMWIGNLNCIVRYDPASKTFTVFEEGIGFSHGGFRIRTAFKSSDNEMFWGTDKGIIHFVPEAMSNTAIPLRPSIHSLQAGNIIHRFTGTDTIRLPYFTSSFVFTFSAGELTGDKKNHLRYRLNGFEKEWAAPITTGQAVYSKLPPGNYTFEIKASRDGIIWHEAPYTIRIYVTAPWWQQNWFRILFALLICLATYYFYSYFQRRKKSKAIESAIAYFASSSYEHTTTEGILWDIARNCISRLGLEDCVIYIADGERKVLIQKAAYGPKSPKPFEIANPIEIPFGKGITGSVALSGKAALIKDTTKDKRYIVDDEQRMSELTIPIIHDNKVIGIIDSEHSRKDFFTQHHLRAMQTIASLCAAKIAHAMAVEAMKKSREELLVLNTRMAETRFLNLRLQMNPHFLFNSLSSIQHLIVSEQTNKAYKYLTVFSNFLRSLLNFAEKNFIPLEEELKILTMYIELESLRFDDSFSWEISADDNLLQEEVLVPSLMVQPFAENAIWHGLLHKDGEKKLSIRFSSDSEDHLSCIIEDNGIGRQNAMAIKEGNIHSKIRESKGIHIITERLELLQQKTGKPATINIVDKYNSTGQPDGTKIEIAIPYYNSEEA